MAIMGFFSFNVLPLPLFPTINLYYLNNQKTFLERKQYILLHIATRKLSRPFQIQYISYLSQIQATGQSDWHSYNSHSRQAKNAGADEGTRTPVILLIDILLTQWFK